MAYKDREKQLAYNREYGKKHYRENKAYYQAKSKRIQAEIRAFIIDSKKRPCADCKVQYPPYVMDFDHLPGQKKRGLLSNDRLWGMNTAKQEIAKCEVVCSNCHRIRTHTRKQVS